MKSATKQGLAIESERFQNGSMDITVKNIPEKVHRTMKLVAEKEGRSLNAQIIHTLQAKADEAERLRHMRGSLETLKRFSASLPMLDDSTALLRKDRER